MTLYILLPVHNRREITRRFLAALKAQTFQGYHLILLDDGSTDGTADLVRTEVAALTVLRGDGTWWWAGALQQGYKWLRRQPLKESDVVLIINDDTEFAPDFLQRALASLAERGELLLAASYGRTSGLLIGAGVKIDWKRLVFAPASTPQEIECLSTRGLFLRANDFISLGGFYPKLLPHYLSDYEFTLRAGRRGMTLRVDDSLRLWVDESATGYHQFEGLPFKDFLVKYFARNSDANPFYWTVFITLTSPRRWLLVNWLRVWYGTGKKLLKAMLS